MEEQNNFENISPEDYKFDPYTGEPIKKEDNDYNYDPYTGEKIEKANPVVEQVSTPVQDLPEENKKETMSAKDKMIANALCIVSLICAVVPGIVYAIYIYGGEAAKAIEEYVPAPNSRFGSELESMIGIMMFAFEVASLVLMIVCRVKYPKHVFGLVLMIVYIVMYVMFIVSWILMIALCYAMCSGLNVSGCPG